MALCRHAYSFRHRRLGHQFRGLRQLRPRHLEGRGDAEPRHLVPLGARAGDRGCRAVELRCRDFDAGGAVCRARSRLYRARLLCRWNGFVEARAIRLRLRCLLARGARALGRHRRSRHSHRAFDSG